MNRLFAQINVTLISIITAGLLGCNEEIERAEASREAQLGDTATINIEGGSFTQVRQAPWGTLSRYEVELSWESLHAEVKLHAQGCQPMLVSFSARYALERYQVVSRVYVPSAQETDAQDDLPQDGRVQIDETVFKPASPRLDLGAFISTDALNMNTQDQETPSPDQETDAGSQMGMMSWSILINGSEEPVAFLTEAQTLNLLNTESHDEYNQRYTQCIQRRQISSEEVYRDQYLIRHHINYLWTPPLRLGVITEIQDIQRLQQTLEAGERSGWDGVVFLGSLSDGTPESLRAARQILGETRLFWWALPSVTEAKLNSTWLTSIGALNYALDIGNIRLLFLELSQRGFSERQLSLITRWVKSTPLSSLWHQSPHTLALFSLTPLVKSAQQTQHPLSYRVGALRALSSLRAAHLTHHIIHGEHSGYVNGIDSEDLLGINILNASTPAQRFLELELHPQCLRSARGEACISWRRAILDGL